jgi:hypothetical protein
MGVMSGIRALAGARGPALALALLAPTVARPEFLSAQAAQRVMYVSALNHGGSPVPNLGPSDFIIREDKVAREILSVTPASDPMQIAVLVDNSQAAEEFLRDYRQAIPAFINAIAADETGARHEISLITLAERPTINTEATTDAARLVKGVQRIFAMPGTAAYLLDGIMEISEGMTKRGAKRPVIVAITTEGPEMSDRQFMTVLEPLRESGAAFHVVALGSPRNQNYDRSVVLDLGTRETGGRNDSILTGNALTGRLKQIAAELTHQYRVVYARPQSLIAPEQITVASGKPGLTVRGTPMRDDRTRP